MFRTMLYKAASARQVNTAKRTGGPVKRDAVAE
jgi:hypothetical protein